MRDKDLLRWVVLWLGYLGQLEGQGHHPLKVIFRESSVSLTHKPLLSLDSLSPPSLTGSI